MEKKQTGQMEFQSISGRSITPEMFSRAQKKNAQAVRIPERKGENAKATLNLMSNMRDNITINPDDAIEVTANQVYSVTLPTGNVLLLKINTDNMKKLTMVTQMTNASNFETIVFVIDPATMTLVKVADSQNLFANSDTVSFLPEGGWYYILTNIIDGDRDMVFMLQKSDTFSVNEPNDSPFQLKTYYTNLMQNIDFFDNTYDVDCSLLNVTAANEPIYVAMAFTDGTVEGNVELYIIDMSTGAVAGSIGVEAPFIGVYWTPPKAGIYCFCLKANSTAILGKEYQLTVGVRTAVIKPSEVRVGQVTGHPDCGKIADGSFWVSGFMATLKGAALDLPYADGKFARIPLSVYALTGEDAPTNAIGLTNSDSGFSISITLPWAKPNTNHPIEFYDYSGQKLYTNMVGIINR